MKRLAYIDILKSVAIVLVLLYHCNFLNDNYYFASILSLCCPLFFAINGCLLLPKRRDYDYYIPKLIKLIALIVIWGCISNIFSSLVFQESYSLKKCFLDLVYLRSKYCNHLWFLCTLFILYLIYPLFINLSNNKKTLFLSLLIISCFSLSGISRLFSLINPLKGWHSYALAYAIGGYAMHYLKITKKGALSFVILLCLGCQSLLNAKGLCGPDMVFIGYKSPFIFVATLCLLKLASLVSCEENRIISFIAKNTLGLYLVHRLFTVLFLEKLPGVTYRYFLPLVVMFISCCIVWLMNKNKYTKWLITL